MRAKAASRLNSGDSIKWRSHEPSRIETFSDATFAFALTLIVVSIEVPKTFDDLMNTMKGAPSFALCFVGLFAIWNLQNIFFRRFGLNDMYTVIVNAALLFVVLLYTYPLKFLFKLITSSAHEQAGMIRDSQLQALMLIYSLGIFAIYLLFYLMYRHAKRSADKLELTPQELYETQTSTYINLICLCICLIAISVALIFPKNSGYSGFVYFLFPVAYSSWFSYRAKKKKVLFREA